MSVILGPPVDHQRWLSRDGLADDSPHAQRMGERILREEGYQVVTFTDGQTAAERLFSLDPDLVIADVFLPRRSGFDLCRHVKANYRYMRVILTAGILETLDEGEAKRAGCDAILKKPFEASVIMETIRPLVQEAQLARGLFAEVFAEDLAAAQPAPQATPLTGANPVPGPPADPAGAATGRPAPAASADPERVQAAITLALQAALPALVREITEKVLVALGH
jgi:CheY-like chemotaxis protein